MHLIKFVAEKRNCCNMVLKAVIASAQYSASVKEQATTHCLFELHDIRLWPMNITQAEEAELLVSRFPTQSASELAQECWQQQHVYQLNSLENSILEITNQFLDSSRVSFGRLVHELRHATCSLQKRHQVSLRKDALKYQYSSILYAINICCAIAKLRDTGGREGLAVTSTTLSMLITANRCYTYLYRDRERQ